MGKNGRRRLGVAPHVQDAMEVTRFWAHVAPPDVNGCRDWLGTTDAGGYGVYVWRGEKFPAHELALTFTTGEICAETLDTCHACDRPSCCAPGHLRFDTRAGNVRDCVERGRHYFQQKRVSDEVIEQIRIRRAHGARVHDLAKEFGFSVTWVSQVCRGLRHPNAPGPTVERRGTGPKRGRNGSRPPDSYISDVRHRRAAGESYAEIAATIDHSEDWVLRVCRGLFYPDVPGPITRQGRRPTTRETTT